MSEQVKIKLVSFGIAGEILGIRQMEYSIASNSTVSDLKTQIIGEYPELASLSSVKFAVAGEYASDDQIVPNGAEVAIIPPVSGG